MDSFAQRVLPLAHVPELVNGSVAALEVHDDVLIVGGTYTHFLGHLRSNLQAWDGSQHFDMGDLFGCVSCAVHAMVPFQGGIVVAGREPSVGHIAFWDGSDWSGFGDGLPEFVRTLAHHDGVLYAAGYSGSIWAWTGVVWEPVGPFLGGIVYAMASYDGQLFVGGTFSSATSGIPGLDHVARWNGSVWLPVGSGANDQVRALRVKDGELLVGGLFNYSSDSALALPGMAAFDGNDLQVMPSIPGIAQVHFIGEMGDGRLLVGGSSTAAILEAQPRLFPFGGLRAYTYYMGDDIVAGNTMLHTYMSGLSIGRITDGDYVESVDLNYIAAMVTPSPVGFYDLGLARPGFIAPKGEGTATIRRTSPWIIGTANDSVFGALPELTFAPSSTWLQRPWAGPLGVEMDQSFHDRYYRVWKVDKEMVLAHVQNWAQPGYLMPEVIANWPGNGDVSNGEPAQLAPFVDVNGDGVYDPWNGDHPAILGDQAVYTITHSASDGLWDLPIMPVDIHSMYYAFNGAVHPEIEGTIFVRYRIINRDGRTYSDVRLGQRTYFAIGCESDDLAGCDTTRSLSFAYNGFDLDEDCTSMLGYGEHPPAQGVVMLNLPMRSHRTRSPTPSPPISAEDWMHGLNNGQPFTLPSGPSHFQYPGGNYTDAFHVSQPARISVAATGPFTLAPGDTLCMDLAFVFARANTGGASASLLALKERVDSVQAFYDANVQDCLALGSVGLTHHVKDHELLLFPNPATNTVHLYAGVPIQGVNMFDMQGRSIRSISSNSDHVTILTGDLARGIYLMQVLLGEGSRSFRVVLE